MVCTSSTHPLRIDSAPLLVGRVGMTFCPGKKQRSAYGSDWDRQLDVDIAVLLAWGTAAVFTFEESFELHDLRVAGPDLVLAEASIAWHHLPIVDGGILDSDFERDWQVVGSSLHVRRPLTNASSCTARVALGLPGRWLPGC